MGWAQLTFRKENKINNITLDITISESASASARLTSNPVEQGANVNDHIIVEPMTFQMEGAVSDTASTVGGVVADNVTRFTETKTKSQNTWNDLLDLLVSRTPFTLEQGLKSYENVVLLTLNETQDKDTSNALFFTATFQELIYVGSQVIGEEQFNESNISDQMSTKKESGQKQLSEVE